MGARILRSHLLMRAPIWICKARAGTVLGSRLPMLEHVGRKSGVRRRVVLEVVDHSTPDRPLPIVELRLGYSPFGPLAVSTA